MFYLKLVMKINASTFFKYKNESILKIFKLIFPIFKNIFK